MNEELHIANGTCTTIESLRWQTPTYDTLIWEQQKGVKQCRRTDEYINQLFYEAGLVDPVW